MALCCGPYLHDGAGAPAPDPLALMRSRYTAYALREEAYLLATWHASTRPACAASLPGTKWLGLEVRNHHLIDDSHAEVEFVARCRVGGKAVRQHERSRFVREAGRWFYVRGVLL